MRKKKTITIKQTTMKIEFIKEEKINGECYWYTTINGKYVDSSLKSDEKAAYNLFKKVKENGGVTILTVVESFDTESQSTN